MRLFRYKEVEQKRDQLLNLEWIFLGSGFMHLGNNNWTISHRFLRKGIASLGTEKMFFIRAQIALDFEPRYSWFSFEAINPFEARWFHLWIKVWKNRNLKVVFNLGWTISRESRAFLERQALEQERRKTMEVRRNLEVIQSGGGKNAGISR